MNEIYKQAMDLQNETIKNRRHLHSNPEIGLDLPNTTRFVMDKLREMGLEPEEICQSAITVNIGKEKGKTILLRGDMDALPMQENADLDFKSVNEFGHLCGHDLHTSMLLTVAQILKDREHELKGTVKLMFQPGEETGNGAKLMIESGVLENPKVDAAIALHVSPRLESGKIEYTTGIASASIDTWWLEVNGVGGHSSTPHLSIDPLMIVNTIYNILNSLVGKEVNPTETAILTIGKLSGGTAPNIIPDTAVLEGAIRCFNNETRDYIVNRIYKIIDDTVGTMRGTYKIRKAYTPSIYNDLSLCNELEPYIKEIIGGDNLTILDKPNVASEDFSFISEKVPSIFIWVGAGDKNNYALHNPNVIFDENAMPVGAAILANSAINWLRDNE